MTDGIIIGGGPAGLSAAIYLLRAGFSVKIIAKDFGALQKAEKIDNYFGFEMPVSGTELIRKGREQVLRLGASVCEDEVTGLSWNKDFIITTPNGKECSKTIILATGTQRKNPEIRNTARFEGCGVSYCAVCDAFFYRGKNVGVLGGGEYALNEVGELIGLAESVSLITNGTEITAAFPKSVRIYEDPVEELFGNDRLEGVRFAGGEKLYIDGLFIAYGTAGATAFAKELGLLLKEGKIETDENMKTSIPGVFAAGDCTGGVLQVSKAVGDGAKAGLSAVEFLRKRSL